MRVVHVVSTVDQEAAGPSYSAPRLCVALGDAGVDAELAAVGDRPSWAPSCVRVFPYGLGPQRLACSPTLRTWLKDEARSGRAQVLHAHGLWMMPNLYPAQAVRGSLCRLVVSPRGMMTAWAMSHHAMRKRLIWHLGQASALRTAACFHATSAEELEDVRRAGFRQPVCVIPNGIDIPAVPARRRSERRRLLFLGRLHEKKGVDVLLRAWAAVASDHPAWELRIAGPGSPAYLAALQDLARQLGALRVIFDGPLYGDAKHQAYRDATLFVLPSHSENFGLAVAEALAAGTPAIVSKGAPWQGLESAGAGWWIDTGVEPLVSCLRHALAIPDEQFATMGDAGREWVTRAFSWDRIARQFVDVYSWIIQGGARPACVHTR